MIRPTVPKEVIRDFEALEPLLRLGAWSRGAVFAMANVGRA
jgi:hypothetical protein